MRLFLFTLILAGLSSCGSPDSKKDGNSVTPGQDDTPITSPTSKTYIYRADKDADKIYLGSIDLPTGTLYEHEAVNLSPGDKPSAMLVTSDQKYLFVMNTGTDTIDTFEINPANGELTLVASRSSHLPILLGRATTDPLNRYVWSHEEENGYYYLIAYKIENDGSLSFHASSIVKGGTDYARNMVADPTGSYLYINLEHGSIVACDIFGTGSVSLITNTTYGGFSPTALAYNSTVSRLFGSPTGNDLVLSLTVGGNGDISAATNVDIGDAIDAKDIAVNSNGDKMYILVRSPAHIKSYSVTTGGNDLASAIDSLSLATGCNPQAMAPLLSNGYLIVPCSDGSGKTYSIKTEVDGTLTIKDIAQRTGMKVHSILAVTFL